MRPLSIALLLGVAGAVLIPCHANAWWDAYGRWHPDRYGRPIYAPPPPAYAPGYPGPYGRWIPQHYDRFGRFIPGHWG